MRRDVFQAIADPNRRAMINLLAGKPLNLNAVADHFDISRPAVSKHIKILTQCGLISIRAQGRERFCHAELEQLKVVKDWVESYRAFWTKKLDALDEVWKAITDKDQMAKWYFNLNEFKPVVGFEFEFEAGDKGVMYLHKCVVTEVVEEKKLAYTWSYEGYQGNSEVSFELFEQDGQTRLKLTHKGLETLAQNNPSFARENFFGGWTAILGTSLKNYLEK
eukprot:gene14723-17400_t